MHKTTGVRIDLFLTLLQRRLLAVELADVLFQRSKVFRGLLAPSMTAFLEQAVGFKRENPLPGPADRVSTSVLLRFFFNFIELLANEFYWAQQRSAVAADHCSRFGAWGRGNSESVEPSWESGGCMTLTARIAAHFGRWRGAESQLPTPL